MKINFFKNSNISGHVIKPEWTTAFSLTQVLSMAAAADLSSCARDCNAHKPKIFIIWPFTVNICWPLVYYKLSLLLPLPHGYVQ